MKPLVTFLLLVCAAAAENPKAPNFTLPNLDGDSVSLCNFCGKIVVIDFWVLWCDVCKEELPKINRIARTYAGKNVAVLGIHLGEKNAAKVKSFVKNAGLSYTVLLDPEETTADLFAIKGTPSVIVIDTAGTIVKKYRELDQKKEQEIYLILDSLSAASLQPPKPDR